MCRIKCRPTKGILAVGALLAISVSSWGLLITEAAARLSPEIQGRVLASVNVDAGGQNAVQSDDKKPKISAEQQARLRQAISAVGIVLVRNPGDPSSQVPWQRGSAVIVREDGIVVTNYHVIAMDKVDRLYDEIFFSLPTGSSDETLTFNRYRLKVILISKSNDLALLRITSDNTAQPLPASFPIIEMADSHAIQALDDLIIIGFPEKGGSSVTVNKGMVEGKDILGGWIKTTARLIHGNSGGAAVNSDGKLIGIPTKVVSDEQRIDKDGDGFPEEIRRYGEIGFLRPSLLVAAMLAQTGDSQNPSPPESLKSTGLSHDAKRTGLPSTETGVRFLAPAPLVVVRGVIKLENEGSPIAGARIGIIPAGSDEVTPDNLLTWGGTNGEGKFELNNPVPPGRYKLRAKAIGYQIITREVEIIQGGPQIVIEMRLSQEK